MNHSELITAGCAVPYTGQEVPKYAAVAMMSETYDKIKEHSVLRMKLLDAEKKYGDVEVLFITDLNCARKEARRDIGL